METILKQLRPENREQTQGIVWGMMGTVSKSCWIVKKGGGSEQRWRWTRQGVGGRKSKGLEM